jgi:hypothetical protein
MQFAGSDGPDRSAGFGLPHRENDGYAALMLSARASSDQARKLIA